jgi:hypothetical protein
MSLSSHCCGGFDFHGVSPAPRAITPNSSIPASNKPKLRRASRAATTRFNSFIFPPQMSVRRTKAATSARIECTGPQSTTRNMSHHATSCTIPPGIAPLNQPQFHRHGPPVLSLTDTAAMIEGFFRLRIRSRCLSAPEYLIDIEGRLCGTRDLNSHMM